MKTKTIADHARELQFAESIAIKLRDKGEHELAERIESWEWWGTDRPLAGPGLTSYRYRGRYGWVMIGAKDHSDALREAQRSISKKPRIENLEVWSGKRYIKVTP